MNERDIENAARELCVLRGADPDKMIRWIDYDDPEKASEVPHWVVASHEVRDFMRIQRAIDFAKDIRKGLNE